MARIMMIDFLECAVSLPIGCLTFVDQIILAPFYRLRNLVPSSLVEWTMWSFIESFCIKLISKLP